MKLAAVIAIYHYGMYTLSTTYGGGNGPINDNLRCN